MGTHTFTTEVEAKNGFIYQIFGSIDYEVTEHEEDTHPDFPTSKCHVVEFQESTLKIEEINSLPVDFFTQKFIEYIKPLLIKELENNHTSDLIESFHDSIHESKEELESDLSV